MAYREIKEQTKVLETFGKNIIVSASAGSGKTSVMIRKILSLIIDKDIKVKDLLVLTYTNAAASEMKQKLINEMANQDNEKVLGQIDDVPLADISTFDSFCQKLVKRYFYVLDIDPGFNILQGSEQKEFYKKSFAKAVKIFKKQHYDRYFDLFNSYASNRTDKNIYEIISKLNSFATSILEYQTFKATAMELFEGGINNKASNLILKGFQNECASVKAELQKQHSLAVGFGFDKYLQHINELISAAEMVINAKDFSKLISAVANYSFGKTPRQEENDETVMPAVKACREYLKAKDKKSIFDRIQKYGDSQNYINSISVCKSITETYFMLYEEFVNQYNILKSSKNMYDYNDIERLTIKLFDNAEVLESIKQNYKNIFVDEFQDANAVQEKIIMSLQNGCNLFFVGDLKQAIYGFRQSNSKIFERIANDFEKDKTNSRSLRLNCNFRTTKPILDFVNSVFSVAMTMQTASLDYNAKSKLEAQGEFKDEKSPCVELNILYKEKQNKPVANQIYNIEEAFIDDDIVNQNAEANFIAERITKLLSEEIYDIKLGKYRKIEYSDIAILFRTRSNQQDFISAFGKAKIPVVEDSNADLEQTYDVQVLINLIRLSVNFKNDYALASVMVSPLFDFDSNQMLQIREASQEKYFYDCVKNYPKNDEIKQKIENMLEKIDKFFKTSTFGGINKALINVLQTQNYEYKILQDASGVNRLKNIRDFVESFNSSKFNLCPSEYINFLEENTREQKVVASAGSNNVVTLTTMHSSKGLEWPVVIIPTLDSKFYRQPKSGEIALNEELGAGVKYYDPQTRQKFPSVFYDVIDNYNKDGDFSERLRLLYVALTRPKNRLILVGTSEKLDYSQFTSDRQVRFSPDYLSIIINSLDGADITKINSKVGSFNFLQNPNFVCNIIDQNSYFLKRVPLVNVANNSADNDEIKKLTEYINTPYFNIEATTIAQKNSVSSILKQEDIFSSYNASPDKLLVSEHLADVQKNELGSLYHKIIEDFDFNNSISSTEIYKVINNIKKSKEFAEEVIKAVDLTIVAKNLKLLKDLTSGFRLIKEHTFVMQIPYNEIQNSQICDNVLVQGICDLIAIGPNSTILVDYKYSTLSENSLKQKYNKQLYLYSKAINYGLNKCVDKVYILSLKDAKLIECNVHK